MKGLSINRACMIGAAFLGSISVTALAAAFLLTGDPAVVWLGLLFIALVRLYEVMREDRESVAKDRADLQELISDISHQVKTPIANLQMVNATMLEQPMPEEKQQEFLRASSGQLEKLDLLMQAMIKTSRLETGVISLDRMTQPLYDTLAAALGGILLNAEKKNIHVSVDCPQDITLAHDRKWTSEALFNILDNAVKYTPADGTICVTPRAGSYM